ncbi:MAG: gfo/Idh/MocA family oxidoreductase [Calditrichaeota bacterium]|nr:MAG: gfo/Idh/MocA family oxidoreductase [Calditrichota bacterium]
MIRFAVLGHGFIGSVHAATLQKLSGAELVGIVEQDRNKWHSVTDGNIKIDTAKAYDAPFFESIPALLAEKKADCISICLPTHLHRDYTVEAMAAGLHVVCEKPMALSLDDCDSMIQAARKFKRQLFIAQCIRFWPEYVLLREMMGKKVLGDLISIKFHRLSGMPSWGGEQSWFLKPDQSGGCLFDLHVHDVDFIQHLLGLPRAVFSCGTAFPNGVNTSVITQYLFSEGYSCLAEASWRYFSGFKMSYSAVFSDGQLEYDSGVQPTLRLWRKGNIDSEFLEVPATDGYTEEYRYFIDCLENHQTPTRMMAESARASIQMTIAELKSIKSGAQVYLP